MQKLTVLLVSTLTVGISGCGERDESQPLFGSPAVPATAGGTSGGTVAANTDNSDSLDESTQESGVGGSGAQGLNPGSVPNNIIAEITTLNAADAFGMRGHKVFAGAPFSFGGSNYEYFNLDFPCEGDGTFEAYPSDLLENAPQESFGTFFWANLEILDTDVYWNLGVVDITTGDLQGVVVPNFLAVDPVIRGDIIVNTTFIEQQPVTRIVQYEQCT